MTHDEFRKLMASYQEQNSEFLRLHPEIDMRVPPATDDEIAYVERELGARLPEEYVWFLKEYGGGIVGYAEIYSVHQSSRCYILDYQPTADEIQNFVAVMDNGCGDYYGSL
jgi:hypothetical protein